MKYRPIMFSGPMVKAIIDGRKTQTRRIVKPQPSSVDASGRWYRMPGGGESLNCYSCPYGVPGDRLWVRETGWERPSRSARDMREGADTWKRYYYDADGLSERDREDFKKWGFRRRPAIHMPRWASRITLEVVNVRVERLQEISEDDAKAEGAPNKNANYRWSFHYLWDSINAKRAPWASNPYVWVVEFKRA